MAKIERSLGQLTPSVVAAPAGAALARAGGGLALGLATGYLSLVVLLPLAALVWSLARRGLGRVLAPGDRSPRRSPR